MCACLYTYIYIYIYTYIYIYIHVYRYANSLSKLQLDRVLAHFRLVATAKGTRTFYDFNCVFLAATVTL